MYIEINVLRNLFDACTRILCNSQSQIFQGIMRMFLVPKIILAKSKKSCKQFFFHFTHGKWVRDSNTSPKLVKSNIDAIELNYESTNSAAGSPWAR